MVVSCEMIFCCKVKDNIGKMQILHINIPNLGIKI